jgi:hypothetical protein
MSKSSWQLSKTTHILLLGRLGVHLSRYIEAQTNRVCLGSSLRPLDLDDNEVSNSPYLELREADLSAVLQ